MKIKKIILIILISLTFVNCKNDNNVKEFGSSKIEDINEIIKTVIIFDSLDVLKNENGTKMLCEELIKLNIVILDKKKDNNTVLLPRSYFNQISIEELLHKKIENQLFFNANDSLILIEQYFNLQKFKIKKTLIDEINLTTIENEINKRKINTPYSYYQMTLPLFSKDNQKAYLELNHYCGRLCASGRSIYLKKINGKWKIIYSIDTWVS